jgi:Fur family transcriptional regulator, ferric uptake regulator
MSELLDSLSFVVREALPTDATALSGLHARCFARPWDAIALSQFIGIPGCLTLIGAHRDESPQGFLIVRVAADEAELLTLCVSPDHRRRGLARALLGAAASQLGNGGTKRLFLEVDEENEPALALYRTLGAEKVGRRSAYYEHGADAAIFSLALSGLGSDDGGGKRQLTMTKSQTGTSRLERLCAERGLRMTGQRRIIARVLSEAEDHPDVEEVYRRASTLDPRISLSTVYRTVRLLEGAGILERHAFGDGRARYEPVGHGHHDHLINVNTGEVIEFHNEQIERLQESVARELGFRLIGHRLELFGMPIKKS